ncbi:unnamed protein product [Larinioides sclopetarius]|uniref:AAA+ ATPase domain-containing protein n=1 Tax=Larinioides sclopetarius TaxID=280406 RepID=A0AAV1Z947_9ARAC
MSIIHDATKKLTVTERLVDLFLNNGFYVKTTEKDIYFIYTKNEELNETTFQRMRERADAYLERSEELKKYLAAEHMKRNVTDISGESPRKEDFKEDEEEEEEEKEEEEEEEEYSSDLQQRLDIVQKPYVKWCDVFGLREAKQILGEAFIMPLKFPHLFTGKRKPWKSILLYGPPGTGKTLLVQALASSVPSSTFIFLSNYLDESDSFLKDLFKNKRAQSPKLILVDEIDAVFNLESTRGMRMELFTYHMEGRDCSDGILILATTNKPWLLNEPLLKRFEKKIYTSFPNWTDRLQILKFCLGDAPHCLTEKNLEELATKTEGVTCFSLWLGRNLLQLNTVSEDMNIFKNTLADYKSFWSCTDIKLFPFEPHIMKMMYINQVLLTCVNAA